MKYLFNSKRGNFVDIPDYLVSALIIGFSFVIAFLILTNFNSGIQTNTNVPTIVKEGSSDFNNAFFKMDYLSVFLYVGFLGFSVVSARFIPSSSKFILIPIMSMILLPFVGFMIENIWFDFFTKSLVQTISDELFWTNLMLNNAGVFSLIYAFFVGISLVSKQEVAQS